jgi:hypothetical protein
MAEVPEMSPRQRWTLVLVCTAVFMFRGCPARGTGGLARAG